MSAEQLQFMLQKGAEKMVATLLASGASNNTIERYLATRFGSPDASAIEQIKAFGLEMVEAGSRVAALDPDESIQSGNIPKNMYLFGDEPGGRRLAVGAEFFVPSANSYKSAIVYMEDVTDADDFYAQLWDKLRELINEYGEDFGIEEDESTMINSPVVSWMEERF